MRDPATLLSTDQNSFLHYDIANRPDSYFSLEAQTGEPGHVLRFDSFSKVRQP